MLPPGAYPKGFANLLGALCWNTYVCIKVYDELRFAGNDKASPEGIYKIPHITTLSSNTILFNLRVSGDLVSDASGQAKAGFALSTGDECAMLA